MSDLRWQTWFLWLVMGSLPATAQGQASALPPILLEDVTSQTGIDFVHSDGGSGKHYLFETVCAGMAVLDYDGDGLMDLYFLNGRRLAGGQPDAGLQTDTTAPPLTNRLYRNLGGLRFIDVTDQAGVGDPGHGLGVCVGDFDNDGDPDLFVNNFGPNVFYQNNGDGTFSVLRDAPTSHESRVGAGASFFDIDGDGDLDLFVGNYIQFSYELGLNRMIFGIPAAPAPTDYPPDSDQLFRNNGDGTFTDVSEISNIASAAGASMGLISFDYDRDGDTDIFVCNDSAANFLWENDGSGKFTEKGLLTGTAYDYAGLKQASMGVDCVDYDHDGWLDLFATNYQDEIPNVYRNAEGIFFDDLGASLGLGVATRSVTWGVTLADFDHDTFADIFLGCGHLIDTVNLVDSSVKFATRNFLLRNEAGKKFVDVSPGGGSGLVPEQVSRAVCSEDLDRDGDLDLVILNLNAGPTLLRNDTDHQGRHWCQLRLIGRSSTRNAAGTRVVLRTGNIVQTQEVHLGRGYQSHYGNSLHFGLGSATKIDQIEVYWHGQPATIYRDQPADQVLTLVQEIEP
jgi:hypothetical protein